MINVKAKELRGRTLRLLCICAFAAYAACGTSGCNFLVNLITGGLAPTSGNIHYGSGSQQTFDFWRAEGTEPRPLIIFFHGGSFLTGTKYDIPAQLVRTCLDAGVSLASANYTYTNVAPFPQPMLDGARVLQFLRYHAAEYGIDPARVALGGLSAGGGIALWVGLHDDMADPLSADPVARMSTRVPVLGGYAAQTSYDPRFWKSVIRGRSYETPAMPTFYGITAPELDAASSIPLYEAASPVNYASADDPPAWLYYYEAATPLADGPNQDGATLYYPQFGQALDGFPPVGDGVHNGLFGITLGTVMTPLGVDVSLHATAEYQAIDPNNVETLVWQAFVQYALAHM